MPRISKLEIGIYLLPLGLYAHMGMNMHFGSSSMEENMPNPSLSL